MSRKSTLTEEQKRFMVMAHYRSGVRQPDGTWKYPMMEIMKQYYEEYPDRPINKSLFRTQRDRLVKRFEEYNCLCARKSTGRTRKLTNEILERIKKTKVTNGQLLSLQTGLSYGTCYRAIQLIKEGKQIEPKQPNLKNKPTENKRQENKLQETKEEADNIIETDEESLDFESTEVVNSIDVKIEAPTAQDNST